MDGLRARLAGHLQDRLHREVTVARRRWPDPPGLVGHVDVQRARIGIRVDGDGCNAQATRGAHHAARDLTAIGDQDFAEHHIRKTPNRVGSIGAFMLADKPSPNTRRVSAGSITPSSHSRALA